MTRGPATPVVRDEALSRVYVVARGGRRRAVVTREDAADGGVELGRSRRRLGVDWGELARAILTDACGQAPARKLAVDYGRFIVAPAGQERRITGVELRDWLATWRPPLSVLSHSPRGE